MPKYTNFEFAIRYLFPNDWVRSWVYSQSRMETGNWTSNICKTQKNYFNIGSSKLGEYQSGSTAYSGTSTQEPSHFANYWSVYQSVYDYYDWVTNPKRRISSNPTIQQGLDAVFSPEVGLVPSEKYDSNHFNFKASITQYFNAAAVVFKAASFYATGVVNYTNAVLSSSSQYTPSNWRYYVNYFITFFIPYCLCIYFTNTSHARKVKTKIRMFTTKF